MSRALRLAVLAATLALAACGSSSKVEGGSGGDDPDRAAFADPGLAACTTSSPRLTVGAGLDAPGRIDDDVPPVGEPATCKGSTGFRFGSGLYDITGVVANTSGMGWENPAQVFGGLHLRQYARAFAIESPCNGKRLLFVDTDTGMIFGTVRLKVLASIAADPELSRYYGPDNVMLSATHTHSGPAGFSHFIAFNLFHFGFDADTFDAISDGMFQAIRLAHANLQAHPDPAPIAMAVDELLNTNINRSLVAFNLNAESERGEFLNERGEQVDTDKRVVQLNLVRRGGSPVGIINWFGVHPTMIGEASKTVSSDMKGFAGLGFERIMKTSYAATPGPDNFVAAFCQADEGDSSPNLFIEERPYPDPTRGGGVDEYDSAAISGTKQLAKGLELFSKGEALSGPIDSRLFFVDMENVTVTDPVVLASLHHPLSMDAPVKRTCTAVLGPSFGAGAEDGPGPLTEGISCASGPDVLNRASLDLQTLFNVDPTGVLVGGFPPHVLPLQLISGAAMCNLALLPPLPAGIDFTCQAEKPVALPVGGPFGAEPTVLPFQVARIGNLGLVALPWEVTTMSARRIRKTMLDVLAPAGIDTVVVIGLANDFVHYLPTREEFSSQQYEGASDIFGPWTLAAVQQELRRLAITLRDGTPAPVGPAYVDGANQLVRPPYVASDATTGGASFGDVVTDVPASAAPGDVVSASFQAGHPRNDLKIQSSYVYAEHQRTDGTWEVVADDRDPALLFLWASALPSPLPIDPPLIGPSTATVQWTIPKNARAGLYRLRHDGAAQASPASAKVPYSGVSSAFTVSEPTSACPD